jgi:predicted GNAT family N-acyltransferase
VTSHSDSTSHSIVVLTSEQTHPLRRLVLRQGTPSDEVRFDDDARPGTMHLGVEQAGEVVAISTWIQRAHPDHPALRGVQLRGMATAPAVRGRGLGSVLLLAGLESMRSSGAELVWARARDTALPFYERHGFTVFGRGYVDLTTAVPHHDIVLTL